MMDAPEYTGVPEGWIGCLYRMATKGPTTICPEMYERLRPESVAATLLNYGADPNIADIYGATRY